MWLFIKPPQALVVAPLQIFSASLGVSGRATGGVGGAAAPYRRRHHGAPPEPPPRHPSLQVQEEEEKGGLEEDEDVSNPLGVAAGFAAAWSWHHHRKILCAPWTPCAHN
jgi:hypothetical protein